MRTWLRREDPLLSRTFPPTGQALSCLRSSSYLLQDVLAETGASMTTGALITATSPSPSLCEPSDQRITMLILFNLTDGPNWSNSSGWPSDITAALKHMPLPDLVTRMASIPLTTGTCMATANASGLARLVLPDHCCWYGISCCGPATCQNDRYCNCTPGLITEIRLRNNQVRAEDGQQ